jgi:hypothetical protein
VGPPYEDAREERAAEIRASREERRPGTRRRA